MRNAKRIGQILVQRLNPDAQISALDRLALHQFLHDRIGGFGRNGKADPHAAAGRREDGIVDADHIALHVKHRPARIAAVDAGISLEVAVIGAALAGVAIDCRNDPGGHRAAEPERVADGDHPVTHPGLTRIPELDEGERLGAADLQHRKVGSRVAPDQFGGILGAIGHGHRDRFHLALAFGGDDVIIRHHITIGRDDEA